LAWFKKQKTPKQPGVDRRLKMPEGLWVKCEACKQLVYKKEVALNANVCPKCDYHFRISARERIALVLDEGSFAETDPQITSVDFLKFKDTKKYSDRIKAAVSKSGGDAIITGTGSIEGLPVVVGVFDFSFLGGSMGSVVGEKITRAIELGLAQQQPVLVFSSSGGARMQESILSLMQMAKSSAALAKLKKAGIPFLSVLTDPTTGGVTASFAMLGDLHIAEPGALIGFAGARVIEQTVREKLPEGFQRAEYLLEHGIIDMVVKRTDLKATLARVIGLLRVKELPEKELPEAA